MLCGDKRAVDEELDVAQVPVDAEAVGTSRSARTRAAAPPPRRRHACGRRNCRRPSDRSSPTAGCPRCRRSPIVPNAPPPKVATNSSERPGPKNVVVFARAPLTVSAPPETLTSPGVPGLLLPAARKRRARELGLNRRLQDHLAAAHVRDRGVAAGSARAEVGDGRVDEAGRRGREAPAVVCAQFVPRRVRDRSRNRDLVGRARRERRVRVESCRRARGSDRRRDVSARAL